MPAQAVDLLRALADLFLEAVPVGLAHLELDRACRTACATSRAAPCPRPARGGVEIEDERGAGLGVPAFGVARFREGFFASASGLRLSRPSSQTWVTGFMASRPSRAPKMPGGSGLCATMPRPFRKIDRYSSMSTAIEIAWRSLRALRASADHRILHVEAEVVHRRRDGGGELDAPLDHLRRGLGSAVDRDAHRLVEVLHADAGAVVVALQELVPVGTLSFSRLNTTRSMKGMVFPASFNKPASASPVPLRRDRPCRGSSDCG